MDLVEETTKALSRPGASEFAVTSGRLPCVRVNDTFEAVSQQVVSTDLILEMLATFGGFKYVDALGPEPTQWRAEVEGLGAIRVVAVRNGEVVKARVVKAEPARAQAAVPAPPPGPPRAPAPVTEQNTPARAAAPIVEQEAPTLGALLAEARRRGASDLHVVATRPPLYRVAAELVAHGSALDPELVERMLLPLVPERLRASFDREGTADFALQEPAEGRFRVNVTRQRTGLKGCFRVIGREVPTLDALGLPATIAQAIEHHQGLIVITGPTGHGKTSTLSALVDLLNRTTTRHVITVEDPVEYVHPPKRAMITQREIGTHTRSFAAALKASLREDPDVIVVGELRDTETVRMALAASETGHLVIGSMNTPSAAKTIDRLVDLFPPGDQPQVRMTLAGGLRLIVSQRLVQNADKTGLHVAAEILPGSIALWNLIRDGKTFQIPSLQQRGKGLGIVRLDDSLGELVAAGKITLEAAQAFAEAPEELAAQMGRKVG
jgi:twitching motility protein PilT